MPEKSDGFANWSEIAPCPAPGFEIDLIRMVEGFVADLPAGAAWLRIGRVPGHPEWPEPYFEVTPRNPKAAPFWGAAVATDLLLAVGEGDWREFCGFARGGTIIPKATWQEEFRWIWLATVAGGFTTRLSLDSEERVIGWSTKLVVNGKDIYFINGRRAERLFGRERVKIVTYEPYG